MLKPAGSNDVHAGVVEDLREPASVIQFDQLIAAARRQYRFVLFFALLGAVVGIGYALTAVPWYSASTQLLIDSRKGKDPDPTGSIAELQFDTGAIDSQVEVLKSERIVTAVIAKAGLADDPGFQRATGSLFSNLMGAIRQSLDIKSWFGSDIESDTEVRFAKERLLISTLTNNLAVKRVARTYVLSIEFSWPDANRAAEISRAFADAYLDDQLESKFDATRRATEWLFARIQELKAKALETDMAVQRFKSDKGLVKSGSSGQLVGEQQLSELNSQLIVARGETARAEAKYERIKSIIDSGQADAAVSEALGSPVIIDLRNKYLKASKTEAELSARLGRNHIQVVSLRTEMREYERLIFDELGRIAESYKSEQEISRSREKALEEGLSGLVGANAGTNETLVALRELEREADTYKNLYQAFLQRYQEAVQKQSFPITEARVITAASRPLVPSHPKKSLVVALATILGLGLGLGIAALREIRDRVFRTGQQVRDELGLEFLGFLPAVTASQLRSMHPTSTDLASTGLPPVLANGVMRYSVGSPLSGYAEVLRSAKVAADITLGGHKPKIIGLASVLPNEGKSTTSKNLASLVAHLGARTLLIDADLRNPGLSRSVAPEARQGLVEVLMDRIPFRELLLHEAETGLDLLPTVSRRDISHTSELISSVAMQALLQDAGQDYDYIFVDLPPVGPIVDVRAAARLFDAFVFVVEWGRTARHVVRATLEHEPVIYEKTIGVVLNKANLAGVRLYEDYGSRDYYYGKYKKYYRDR
ncbi:GNVR domain-containing protein [Prosthecomicrobium hirschii]|uniref:GNVR domain-containing protein n=1 Tax=Prosthecodimorpha hirschii TaxID=665126 RepID=UPI0009F90DEB|nr:GNVR domain-containing protein [Prosthecomicrobium hirschii]